MPYLLRSPYIPTRSPNSLRKSPHCALNLRYLDTMAICIIPGFFVQKEYNMPPRAFCMVKIGTLCSGAVMIDCIKFVQLKRTPLIYQLKMISQRSFRMMIEQFLEGYEGFSSHESSGALVSLIGFISVSHHKVSQASLSDSRIVCHIFVSLSH